MATLAALLERRTSLDTLRGVLGKRARVISARSPEQLHQLLCSRLIDLVVIGLDAAQRQTLSALRSDYATLPVMIYAGFRSDDADLLLRVQRDPLLAVAIEGVDEPALARLMLGHGVTARREAVLLPRVAALDLTDELQQRCWKLIVRQAPAGLDGAAAARQLKVARETLSRRFGAGGSPGLKRAVDGVRLFAAGRLLGNAAYQLADVARLLGYSSVSLLQKTSRRTLGVPAGELALLSDQDWEYRLLDF